LEPDKALLAIPAIASRKSLLLEPKRVPALKA